MSRPIFLLSVAFYFVVLCPTLKADLLPFRPPATPLIVSDPYLSVWSFDDTLTEDFPMHWTGAITAFVGLIRIDGTPYRFMGPQTQDRGTLPAPMKQVDLQVFATKTVYMFEQSGVQLQLSFTTPSLLDAAEEHPEIVSQPVTFLELDVSSTDGEPHKVSLYYDNTAEIVVNSVTESVVWSRWNGSSSDSTFSVMQIGTEAQNVLGNKGDRIRINWGHFLVATDPTQTGAIDRFCGALECRDAFVNSGALPPKDDMRMPRQCNDDWPVIAVVFPEFVVNPNPNPKWILLTIDEVMAVNYFGEEIEPYWKSFYGSSNEMIKQVIKKKDDLLEAAETFNHQLITNMTEVGGDEYATLGSLVYRQVLGGCTLTKDEKGVWRYFLKEISSNGDFQTMDVIYPASPMFLKFHPRGLYHMLKPIIEYAANRTSHKYPYDWCPHHLGTYPIADVEPSQQENMPVEESGNMIVMFAGIAKELGGIEFMDDDSWMMLDRWANYLIGTAEDPGDQLCTDDFEGPTPHNANLAGKGIVGLGAYAFLLQMKGEKSLAQKYITTARSYAKKWMEFDADNGTTPFHYRLEYDKGNTWSLKYNLIWDQYLGLGVFPAEVVETELKFYSSQMSHFGLALDNRKFGGVGLISKWDWNSWIAAMASDDQFQKLSKTLFDFANETESRCPLTDWYFTDAGVAVGGVTGFRARPVVGGMFFKMLFSQHTTPLF